MDWKWINPIYKVNEWAVEELWDWGTDKAAGDAPPTHTDSYRQMNVIAKANKVFSDGGWTYYKAAPHPWLGYTAVWIKGYVRDSKGGMPPLVFTKNPQTLTAVLRSMEGRVWFLIGVEYLVYYPNSDPPYDLEGKDALYIAWNYQIGNDGKILLAEPESEHFIKSDQPHFDYSSTKFTPSVEKTQTNVTMSFRTSANPISMQSGSVTTSRTGTVGGEGKGVGASRQKGYQQNPSVATVSVMSWSLDDLAMQINLTPPALPKPVMPKLPEELTVKFSPECNTEISDTETVRIKEWLDKLLGSDFGVVRDLLLKKKIVVHVDGYASKTWKESENWTIYSYQRAEAVAKFLQTMAGGVLRKDGSREYDIEIKPKAKGVAPWAKDPKAPGYKDDVEARVVKIGIDAAEVSEAVKN